MNTYSEKLKDPRWQRKRLEVMERDEFKCSVCCEGDEMLIVHHRYYISGRLPWEYPSWALRTVCENCHRNQHEMDIHRDEGHEIPMEDYFETIFGFLGAGDDFNESQIWDLSVEVNILCKSIGRQEAFGKILNFMRGLKKDNEK